MTGTAMFDPGLEKVARGIVAAQDEAWNRGDATAFGEHALDDVVFISAVGAFSIGRNAFVTQHQRLLSTIYAGSTIRQTVETLVFLSNDAMLVTTYARLEGAKETPPGVVMVEDTIHLRPSLTLVRRGSWGFASYVNVAVRPGVAAIPRN